ncbi:MFS transporter [Daejeonella lutea]|uniref:Predicted arabinose efflux permease, MFS family n=1 Tax=Daejeonella lutea TaxID=572036 RepID=A0A1T5CVL5_9SPHI|nr:MFS transporter [Daejeonella lutea]SKB63417.1 Predicted arabinose efflux permease, MFS family [Daejeonella lutea]
MSSKEKIVLLLLAALNFTHILDFMIMMPLGNYLMPYFKISPQQFSMLVASYTFSAGIAGFLAAFFVDNFDRKRVLLFGYIGFLLGTLFCALAPTYTFLLLARIVAGIFGGLIGAQVLSIVADLVPYERRGMAMGIIMAAFSVASVFGVPFGLYMANLFNWHGPFFFVAGFGALLVPFLMRYLPKMDKHLTSKESRISPVLLIKEVWRDTDQMLALGLTASLMLGHFMIIPFFNPFMEFNMGYSKLQTPMLYMAGGLATLITSPFIGKFADSVGKHKVYIIMAVVSIFPVAILTNLPPMPFYMVLCISGLWFIFSSGRSIPAQAMVSNVVSPERRGSFMSFNSSVQQIFVGLASVISGLIVVKNPDNSIQHYELTGYLSIFITLLTLVFVFKLDTRLKAKLSGNVIINRETGNK